MNKKRIYLFGNGKAEGKTEMKNLLGGKGANLAEMNLIGIPVPPGFTITTETCAEYFEFGQENLQKILTAEVENGIQNIEKVMNTKFGDVENPCLLSVRSGARVSMPGMMDTILNLGLNEKVVEGLVEKSGNPRFVWDSYRRLIQMYGDVVLGLKPASKEEIDPFEEIIDDVKEKRDVQLDMELEEDDLKELVKRFKETIKKNTGSEFPENPRDQLWGAIFAVFNSWNTDRAEYFRQINNIPSDWGTAVNVQAMVFGNMSAKSATGVAFTRDASTGENLFNGEYLINAQGEDVVAGIRTPQQITYEGSKRWAKLSGVDEKVRKGNFPSLEERMPEIFNELVEIETKLENHFRDMQDLEFTVQEGKLWILQTRNGKRTGFAMINMAIDMLEEGLIDEKSAVSRIEPNKLEEILHPVFDPKSLSEASVISKGLPASPGAASGKITFFADDVEKLSETDKDLILVRIETSPEDVKGMNLANGILTARGGMTSHAAVVARGMGKCCVSGAGDIKINYKNRTFKCKDKIFKEGDWISLNGTTGEVLDGKIDTVNPEMSGNFGKLMNLCDKLSKMNVRTNADTPEDAKIARDFGAKGIGLCRTEHMFFKGERIKAVREMILAADETGRRKALNKLLPIQREDFRQILEVMHDLPVTIRLLDPPLHEFIPHDEENQKEMAEEMGVSFETIKMKVDSLSETNPMLGHRGCRLGNTYPEITEMQTRAIIEAALELKKKGIKTRPEIMVPLVGTLQEFILQKNIISQVAEDVFIEQNKKIDFLIGTMIEIPRAALRADEIAGEAEFFSFGTNDLTQMTFGYSRDDVAKFLPIYLEKGILENDPFEVLDQQGVGDLMMIGIERGRSVKKDLKVGICGEHGGEPESVKFCHRVGMNYVSCSPFRVAIARLAAAQAGLEE